MSVENTVKVKINVIGKEIGSNSLRQQSPLSNQLFMLAEGTHCVKSVLIRSYSRPHFPTFALNTKRYGVSLRIQSECGKMQTRATPNTDTFHAVTVKINLHVSRKHSVNNS